jgi:hypothetical protein
MGDREEERALNLAFQTLLDGTREATEQRVELTALRKLCSRGKSCLAFGPLSRWLASCRVSSSTDPQIGVNALPSSHSHAQLASHTTWLAPYSIPLSTPCPPPPPPPPPPGPPPPPPPPAPHRFAHD